MSDREIMNSKYPSKKIQEFMDDESNQIITIFEEEYPDYQTNFKKYKKKCMKCLLVNIWIMG